MRCNALCGPLFLGSGNGRCSRLRCSCGLLGALGTAILTLGSVIPLATCCLPVLASLALLMSIFGWKVAVAYVVLGIVIAVVGGTVIGKLKMERYVEDFVLQAQGVQTEGERLAQKERLAYAGRQMAATRSS